MNFFGFSVGGLKTYTVALAWQTSVRGHNSAMILNNKLKNVRRALRNWSEHLSRLALLIQNSAMVLSELDALEELPSFSSCEKFFRPFLQKNICCLQKLLTTILKKKVCNSVGKVWFENTKFFYHIVKFF